MRTVLVANRGEVAVRVLQAAAGLGLRGVAVFADDDRDSAHVARADVAARLPGDYLDAEALVAAAVAHGADAVHPGYGFLAESPGFATACAAAGLTFVGPAPETLALFGDKAAARRHAAQLGVPVPEAVAPAEAVALLARCGAVMVKAVAGGGGRGLEPVTDSARLDAALARCAEEARRGFGDGTVIVEELIRDARHIEVQLAGDGRDVVHLHTRDCSLQWRRQKLVEIAPAPGVDAAPLLDAALALGRSVALRGLATVELLVRPGGRFAFLEVNARLQVEHTVTEEVLGLDLVAAQLRLADGATLAEAGLGEIGAPSGTAVQLRVSAEPGRVTRFGLPTGRGVRVETHASAGYVVSPRYDPLLAKVVVHDRDLPAALAHAARALRELDVAGVRTNAPLLAAVLERPEVAAATATTTLVDDLLEAASADASAGGTAAAPLAPGNAIAATLAAPLAPAEDAPGDPAGADGAVRAPLAGIVVELRDAAGSDGVVAILEAMKMLHDVVAAPGAVVRARHVAVGDAVAQGALLAEVDPSAEPVAGPGGPEVADLDAVRPDLQEVVDRRAGLLDAARPGAVARRRATGRRTARENVADLCDPGTFREYGGLTLAAQRRRRTREDLLERSPADGLVCGTAAVDGRPCVVLAYDATVFAGTQGHLNHRKTDRLLELAERHALPVVLFAEGGGGRPGETDMTSVSQLDVPTFALFARLAGRVPLVAIVAGRCFAGNAALAGCADVLIATRDANLGMGGPAMIEGGGLGVVAPEDVGPMDVQTANGVVDVLVEDEAEAVAAAKRYLALRGAPAPDWSCADQRELRACVPADRRRAYDVRAVVGLLADAGSVLELRAGYGAGIITALARLEGRAVGIVANDPRHLGGAIAADAAEKATRFLARCDAAGLPVVALCDTPGFMVGPEAERTATVRRFADLFVAGARLAVPLALVVLRKAYGLGAMAMAGGHLHAPVLTVAWPTAELGAMGLEGAVRLAHRDELAAIADPAARDARFGELVGELYARGKGLVVAEVFELDDVIDPADTRAVLAGALAATA